MNSKVQITHNELTFSDICLYFSVFNINLISLIMFCAKGKQEAFQGVINLCTNQSRDNSYSYYHFQVILLFLPALWITTVIITIAAALIITIIIFNINSELYQLCNLSHLLYTFTIIILINSHDFNTLVK